MQKIRTDLVESLRAIIVLFSPVSHYSNRYQRDENVNTHDLITFFLVKFMEIIDRKLRTAITKMGIKTMTTKSLLHAS